jgi:hypothetical protein
MKYRVESVFVTEGVPEFTFVPPPNYNDILVDFRKSGKPVVIEGQSGTGKTCTARKILKQVSGTHGIEYLTARKEADVERIQKLSDAPQKGTFIIDDFHRLPIELRSKLADIAKVAAEEGEQTTLPKLIMIGINQVGSSLIQLAPDIAKRCGIHRIVPGTRETVTSLIQTGCKLLNLHPFDVDAVFSESKGDYWLTQNICQSVCTLNGILETADNERSLPVELISLRKAVVDRLSAGYYPAVKEFCRGKRFRPGNDPYLRLLKTVGEQGESTVDLNMLANSIPDVRGSINNIKEKRLSVLLQTKPLCTHYFYYDHTTKFFAIEDPALFYFIKHLDWDRLRLDCGFRKDTVSLEYDFAISFAGENRELAKCIADQLDMLDTNVFLDEYYEANFLGSTWSTQLKRIFSEDSRLVICILEKHHKDKIWPTFERECFLPRVPTGTVIPIYLDDTVFPGIPQDLIGIKFKWDRSDSNWIHNVTDEIAFKLHERLERLD